MPTIDYLGRELPLWKPGDEELPEWQGPTWIDRNFEKIQYFGMGFGVAGFILAIVLLIKG
jgi:hypothetical protein